MTHIPASSLTPSLITSELAFISHSLLADQKNYHTWAYRQFVLTHFSALLSPVEWEAEQRWVDSLLRVEEGGAGVKEDEHAGEEQDDEEEGEWEEIIGGEGGEERHKGDVRNNSAWGHRWFLAFGRVDAPGPTAMQQEIECVTLYQDEATLHIYRLYTSFWGSGDEIQGFLALFPLIPLFTYALSLEPLNRPSVTPNLRSLLSQTMPHHGITSEGEAKMKHFPKITSITFDVTRHTLFLLTQPT